MKVLFWVLVIAGCLLGLVAVRLREKIKSAALRTAMLVLGALALFAITAQELYSLTDEFSAWKKLVSVGGLVPLGWFLGGCFVLFVLLPRVGWKDAAFKNDSVSHG